MTSTAFGHAGGRIEVPVGELVFDALAAGPADGELVLLLHGFPQAAEEWRAQLEALGEAGYRAVAPDQRGYSPRARPQGVEHYLPDHLVADVVAVADWLGGHRVHVVGHDWGALVAWRLAGRFPDRVRSLTAVSVPHPFAVVEAMASGSGDQPARSAYIAFFRLEGLSEKLLLADEGAGLRALFSNTGYTDRAAMERYVARLRDPGALTAALNWYRALGTQWTLEMGPVTAPTLFVWSTDAPAIGREAAEACGRYVEGPYRFEVLEEVGHWVPEEAAADLNRLLLAHLRGLQ
ncbi:MAG TPA: alpha/beta hydrolase [Acidimicrobiales bacterium]|nr:alpha/beta hydrolase [Acidimicrobiales bacterium]